jgi:large subunit ribosomal protein L4
MELAVYNTSGKGKKSKIEVSQRAFGMDFNGDLVHQAVTAFLSGGRQGTKGQKNRSAVSGGGKKPFRQKGTGRARAGTTRGPLWRGGGVTFAAQQQEHFKKLNKKMYQSALRSVMSELARQERLIVVKDFSIKAPKTKELVAKLADFEMSDGLIVTTKLTDDLILASRNLRKVEVCEPFNMDLVSLIGSSKVLITVDAVKRIEEHLG